MIETENVYLPDAIKDFPRAKVILLYPSISLYGFYHQALRGLNRVLRYGPMDSGMTKKGNFQIPDQHDSILLVSTPIFVHPVDYMEFVGQFLRFCRTRVKQIVLVTFDENLMRAILSHDPSTILMRFTPEQLETEGPWEWVMDTGKVEILTSSEAKLILKSGSIL